MRCPHCDVAMHVEWDESEAWAADECNPPEYAYSLRYDHCPSCGRLIVLLVTGTAQMIRTDYGLEVRLAEDIGTELLFPKVVNRSVAPEVPERYANDFTEAAAVMVLSPKASAAISRRVLQDILSNVFEIKAANLAAQIDSFIELKEVPAYLAEAVDAVRNVGNFAAHPLKDTATGQVLDVEPGEAEWLLDVLDSLFELAFVQPVRLKERKDTLNEKLAKIGKPPMKGKTA